MRTRSLLVIVVLLGSFALLILLLLAPTVHAQTRVYTNADIGNIPRAANASADVYDALKAHEFHAPIIYPRGPFVASTGATGPTAGPWTWPEPRPALRLDGTPLWMPPTVYGAPLFLPFYEPYSNSVIRHYSPQGARAHSGSERKR